MPRSIAVSSSSWSIIGTTTATEGLTSKPTGTHSSDSISAWYSSTHLPASSGSTKENESAPIPLRAAKWIVSRRLHATHRGGCGFCGGFGVTFGGGVRRESDSQPADGSPSDKRQDAARAASPTARFG